MSERLHIGNISKLEALDVFGQLQLIAQVLALIDDILAAEEIGQFNNVVDVVAILDVVGLVYHTDVVEDVVLTDYELQQDYSYRPNVRLVGLVRVM